MKEKLEAILRTLEEAQRQVAEAKERDGLIGNPLEEIEVGLEWVARKLERLKESEEAT